MASSSKGYGSYKQLNQKLHPTSSSSNSKSSSSNSVNNNNSTKNNNNENRSSGSIVKTATVKRSSPTNTHQPARSFQYESFHVFNWDEYLEVSMNDAVAFRTKQLIVLIYFRKRTVRPHHQSVSNRLWIHRVTSSKLAWNWRR